MSEPEFTSDPWLDARLRNVPLPLGFLAKLQEIGTAETQQLDRALRDVPLPDGMFDRLRLISRQPQHRVAWRPLAMAASLLLAVGLGMLGFVFKSAQPLARQTPGRTHRSHEVATLERDGSNHDRDGQFASDNSSADRRSRDEIDAALERESLDAKFDGREFENWEDPAKIALDDLAPRSVLELGAGPAPAMPKVERRSLAQLQRDDLLGARGAADVLPDLDAVEVHVPRGLTPPLVAGYDLLFQLKHGLHPLVDPSAHKDLRTVQVPLVTSSGGYRRAWRWLKEGRLPAAGDLRTEEFLAAMDYGFPAVAEGKVAIRTAGGPAPLRDEGLSLLQVAVQAGALPHEAHGPTHLTIVLDTSAGMRRPDRWAAVQAALGRLRDPMGPADHVTLIGYSDQPELLVDSVGREEAGQLLSALQTSQPRRAANLAAGLNLACSVLPHPADETAPTETVKPNEIAKPSETVQVERRILVISSGRVDSDSQSAERTRSRLAELAKSGVSLQMLDLGRNDSAGDNHANDALAAWTEAADGRLIRIADPSTLSWNLIEALIGRSPVVAAQTSLRVSFNPNVVAAYRLLGHERTTITGPSHAQTEVDLRAGESASGLFEVWLKPTGGNDVATVDVTWQMPGYGQMQRVKQSVSRGQFARSFSASAPSLQIAALAALSAETLRGSTFAPASRSLSRVVELAQQLSPALLVQPSVRELTDFIQLAERVRMHGAALRRNAERKTEF